MRPPINGTIIADNKHTSFVIWLIYSLYASQFCCFINQLMNTLAQNYYGVKSMLSTICYTVHFNANLSGVLLLWCRYKHLCI